MMTTTLTTSLTLVFSLVSGGIPAQAEAPSFGSGPSCGGAKATKTFCETGIPDGHTPEKVGQPSIFIH